MKPSIPWITSLLALFAAPTIGWTQAEGLAQRPIWPERQTTQPATPEQSSRPSATSTTAPTTPTNQPSTDLSQFQESGFAAGGSTVAVADTNAGYIDSALIRNTLRVRYDTSYHWPQPNRAEFFWPNAGGPVRPELAVDFQDATLYLEAAYCPQVSVFVEAPVRWVNPEVNDNSAGYADMNFGFKWAMWQRCHATTTLQVRFYAPTGDADRGLGNDHFTVEPALLFNRQLAENLTLEAEFRDWMPIDGGNFSGNILRYGVGLSYKTYDDGTFKVSPLAELIGWSVLDGLATYVTPFGVPSIQNAGTTIVNLKAGVRVGTEGADFYMGYGRALTGTTWYEDTFRIEFRIWR
jgi:hypothetical protein